MKKFAVLALLCGSFMLSFDANAQQPQTQPAVQNQPASAWRGKIDDYYRYVGPDFDLQVGAGYHWDTANKMRSDALGMGRVRVGLLYVPKWPWAFSVGVTGEVNNMPVGIFGGQAEALHLATGWWLRGGGALDHQGRPHFNAALGWSLFGAEVQGFSVGNSNDPREGVALLATVRVPVGYLIYVLSKK